ncbi:hypothetical protein CRM22_001371 [Opisthorchis felineus]|uniref:tRNA-intron lyase n=2 Tax=Opisthorchis felineus TaxID=147828 RepID=A0A4S2MAR9_OPIFE|nr:hypothetical protein CRM22_001371 [Opisthorchis felineus]
MAEAPRDLVHPNFLTSHRWCVSVTGCGEFLVWTASAAKWLREDCRIIGRASYSVEMTAKSSGSSSNVPNRLPVRLSFEETVHLLNSRVICGVTVPIPISQVDSPTSEQKSGFAAAVDSNRREMQELFQAKRRLELSGYYGQLVHGLAVSKQRHARGGDAAQLSDESKKLSVRQRRKMIRLQKKRLRSSVCEITTQGEEDNEMDFNNSEEEDSDVADAPTLVNLIDYYDRGRAEPVLNQGDTLPIHENYEDPIPRHNPRPTPLEWIRPGEVEYTSVPDSVLNGGLCEVASWLNEQLNLIIVRSQIELDSSTPVRLPNVERLRLRCRVFSDLWSKGFYITTSSAKMGGDFLVYPGDPLLFHASHIIVVHRPDELVLPHQLAARLRLANSVRKILVLATVSVEHPDPGVFYTSFSWTNWLRQT